MNRKKVATPHLIPGTEILKNKYGITDQAKLNQLERLETATRRSSIPDGNFSPAHLKKIHKHLFKNIYEWAGEFRDIPTEKGTTVFCRPEYITQEAEKVAKMVDVEELKAVTPKEFAAELGKIIGELNVVHPFLEGNGRTMRAYAEKISEKAGYRLDITKLNKKEWNNACIVAYHQDSKMLAGLLQKHLKPTAVKKLQQQRQNKTLGRGLSR